MNVTVAALGLAVACSSPSGPDAVTLDPGIPLEGGSALVFEDAGRLDAHRALIEQQVKATTTAVRQLMPLSGVRIRAFSGTSLVIPALGIGGRALGTEEIELMFDPGSAAMPTSLESELFPLLAHEMHHIMRHRNAGFSANLFEAMILEGLADHFSIEVADIDPPIWSTALDEEQLATWSARAEMEWFSSSYDHGAWFLGTGTPPLWAGYTIGFDLVRVYLEANPGRLPSQLYVEPAASFLPQGSAS